ncbi:MAG: hypothetical protein GY725_19570 [bacterium]|nr:hypothetical protein [bacterium]
MSGYHESFKRLAIGLLLIIAILIAYAPVWENEFVDYDDDVYVTDNPRVTGGWSSEDVHWAFFQTRGGNWHPVTWLSHMLDVELFGLDPRGHHAVNLAFHAANTLLLFALLIQLTGSSGCSAFVAILFALHPLQVETVAWIAERKSLLSSFFGFGAISCYVRFARTKSRYWYASSLAAFGLSLGSKSMLVTLPFALLLLDVWPLGRTQGLVPVRLRSLVREKSPYFGLSLAISLITVFTQWPAISTATPFPSRVANAIVAYVRYLGKFFWPQDLVVFYPYPDFWPVWQVSGALIALMMITALALRQRRNQAWLLVGWLWFLGLLFPTIGLVQVGGQSLADRYMYVPIIGLGIIVVWLTSRVALSAGVLVRDRWLAFAGLCLAATLSVTTHAQAQHWKDTIELFGHAVHSTKDNTLAQTELGIAWVAKNRPDLGIIHLGVALRLDPNDPRVLGNYGWALVRTGDLRRGTEQLRHALELRPSIRNGAFHLAWALEMNGEYDEAMEWHREQLGIDPGQRGSLLRLSRLLAAHPEESQRNGSRALRLVQRACAYRTCTEAWELDVFAMALMEAGRPQKALALGQRAWKAARQEEDVGLAVAIERRLDGYAEGIAFRLSARRNP